MLASTNLHDLKSASLRALSDAPPIRSVFKSSPNSIHRPCDMCCKGMFLERLAVLVWAWGCLGGYSTGVESGEWLCRFEKVSRREVKLNDGGELGVVGGKGDFEKFIILACACCANCLSQLRHLSLVFLEIKQYDCNLILLNWTTLSNAGTFKTNNHCQPICFPSLSRSSLTCLQPNQASAISSIFSTKGNYHPKHQSLSLLYLNRLFFFLFLSISEKRLIPTQIVL